MRTWAKGTARAALLTASFVALGAGTVLPGSAYADTTSGKSSVLGGNQLNLPISAPIEASGNSAAAGGTSQAGSQGGATVADGAGGSGGGAGATGGGQKTSGESSVAGGNQVNAPVSAPINACGNAVAIFGTADAGCKGGAKVDNGGGGGQRTSGNSSVAGGNQVNAPVSAPANACGNAVAVFGSAEAGCAGGAKVKNNGGGQATNGETGVAGGNQVNAPVSAPINICGNSAAIFGHAVAGCQGGAKVKNGGHAGAGQQTSGTASVAGGNQVNAPVSAPVDLCGNAVGDAGAQCDGGASVRNGGHGSGGQRTSGENGILSGNQANAPVSVPVSACGNGAAVLGQAAAMCEGGAHVRGGSGGGQQTSGRNGIGSGNQANAPVTIPVNICGNAAAVLGDAVASCTGTARVDGASSGSGTSGESGAGAGNQANAPTQAPPDVCGNVAGVAGRPVPQCADGSSSYGGVKQISGSRTNTSAQRDAGGPLPGPVGNGLPGPVGSGLPGPVGNELLGPSTTAGLTEAAPVRPSSVQPLLTGLTGLPDLPVRPPVAVPQVRRNTTLPAPADPVSGLTDLAAGLADPAAGLIGSADGVTDPVTGAATGGADSLADGVPGARTKAVTGGDLTDTVAGGVPSGVPGALQTATNGLGAPVQPPAGLPGQLSQLPLRQVTHVKHVKQIKLVKHVTHAAHAAHANQMRQQVTHVPGGVLSRTAAPAPQAPVALPAGLPGGLTRNLPMFAGLPLSLPENGPAGLPAGLPVSRAGLPVNPADLPVNTSMVPVGRSSTAPMTASRLPANPATLPADPATVPVDPATVPVDPATVPVDPATLPVDPATLPVDPATLPVKTSGLPVSTTGFPVDTSALPVDPAVLPAGMSMLPVNASERTPSLGDAPVAAPRLPAIDRHVRTQAVSASASSVRDRGPAVPGDTTLPALPGLPELPVRGDLHAPEIGGVTDKVNGVEDTLEKARPAAADQRFVSGMNTESAAVLGAGILLAALSGVMAFARRLRSAAADRGVGKG